MGFVLASLATLAGLLGPDPECRASPRAPRLDHVVVAVRDLGPIAARLRTLGFRIKPGRLHPDNLLNQHVKFRDGSEIELMTMAGIAGDRMAEEYQALLADGDGGGYVALRADSLDQIERAATGLGLEPRRSRSGPWRFLSFPPKTPLAAVFFVSGGVPAEDPDSLLRHDDGSSGLASAWVEAGPDLIRLLEAVGARRCAESPSVGSRPAVRIGLGAGSVTIVSPGDLGRAPRPLGVILAVTDPAARDRPPIELLPGFRIAYR